MEPENATLKPDEQASSDQIEKAARTGCARVTRGATYALIAVVGCAAVAFMLLVLGAFGVSQLGPGGALSPVRPGSTAPDFELPTLDGGYATLSDYRGHPVILNFWATYCRRCAKELPALAGAAERHADVGLVVLTVNPGQWGEHVEWFLDEHGVSLPVAFDVHEEVWRTYRIIGLPTTVFIDRDGIVRAVELDVLTPELIDEYVAQLVAVAPEAEP